VATNEKSTPIIGAATLGRSPAADGHAQTRGGRSGGPEGANREDQAMANPKTITAIDAGEVLPAIRDVDRNDLKDALAKGLDDFKAMPTHVFLLVVIYPIVGAILIDLTFGYDILPLVFPLIAGFTLIGPLAAVGLYEMSRLRENGGAPTWRDAFSVIRSPALPSIAAIGLLQLAIYLVWLAAALAIYNMTLGPNGIETYSDFMWQVLTTPAGWTMIIVGSGIGFLFAVAVLMISVISFPMLLDRNVSAATAVQTSIRACLANPQTMSAWGFMVAALLAIGMVPLFVGLAIVMPILGHATWHLYRKVVGD
jgi:uncharacterized membrane protein